MERCVRKISVVTIILTLAHFTCAGALLAEPISNHPSVTASPSVEISKEGMVDRVRPVSDLENPDELLPMLTDLLNRDAAGDAKRSFESLRRNAAFQVEETMASQFLSFESSKRSA